MRLELGHSVEMQSKIASSQCLRHGRFNATMIPMSRNINNFLAFFIRICCKLIKILDPKLKTEEMYARRYALPQAYISL